MSASNQTMPLKRLVELRAARTKWNQNLKSSESELSENRMKSGQNQPGTGFLLSRDARRLLLAMSQTGAQEGRSDLRTGFITVPVSRHGVTTIVASVKDAAGDELITNNLGIWQEVVCSGNDKRRLVLTADGKSQALAIMADENNTRRARQRSPIQKPVGPDDAIVWVNEAESPLSWLASRKGRDGIPFLGPVHLAAGVRFHRDVEMANIVPRVTSDWSGLAACGGSGQGACITDSAISARSRIDRIHNALGSDMGGLLVDICGFQKGLELVERERQWPARTAKIVLRIALDRLASHYGMASVATGPRHNKGLRHWGAPEFRPSLETGEQNHMNANGGEN